MKISKRSQYGLRAMVYLANPRRKGEISPLKEISREEGIPFDFLEKIIAKLEAIGLVNAKKGVQGGYFLAKNPRKIKVGQIIKALEGEFTPVFCLAKETKRKFSCPRKRKCLTRSLWKKIQNVLNSTLDSITLKDLLKSRKK